MSLREQILEMRREHRQAAVLRGRAAQYDRLSAEIRTLQSQLSVCPSDGTLADLWDAVCERHQLTLGPLRPMKATRTRVA